MFSGWLTLMTLAIPMMAACWGTRRGSWGCVKTLCAGMEGTTLSTNSTHPVLALWTTSSGKPLTQTPFCAIIADRFHGVVISVLCILTVFCLCYLCYHLLTYSVFVPVTLATTVQKIAQSAWSNLTSKAMCWSSAFTARRNSCRPVGKAPLLNSPWCLQSHSYHFSIYLIYRNDDKSFFGMW